jgi:PadR family transcriptional regulator, regulatory protein PadR
LNFMAPTDVSALGEFEQVVLLSILRLGDDAYAVSVRDEIARCTGREVSRGSIYITLDRLETKGYLKSRLADPTPERGGRAKRYYALRPRAIEALRDSRRALVALWRGLEGVLGQA